MAWILLAATAAARSSGRAAALGRIPLTPAPGHGFTAAVGGLRLLVDTGSILTWACVDDSRLAAGERGVFRVRYGDGSTMRGRLFPCVATPLRAIAALTRHHVDWLVGAAPKSACRGRLRGLDGVLGLGPHEPARRPARALNTPPLYAAVEPGDRAARLSLLSALRIPSVHLQPSTPDAAATLSLAPSATRGTGPEGAWGFTVPRPSLDPGRPALAQWRVPARTGGPRLLVRAHGHARCWEAPVRLRAAGGDAGRVAVLVDTGARWWRQEGPSYHTPHTPHSHRLSQGLRCTTFRARSVARFRCPAVPALAALPPRGPRWPLQWAPAQRQCKLRPWPTLQARQRAPAST